MSAYDARFARVDLREKDIRGLELEEPAALAYCPYRSLLHLPEVDALYGWFDRRPFDEESKEFVWVTRRPV